MDRDREHRCGNAFGSGAPTLWRSASGGSNRTVKSSTVKAGDRDPVRFGRGGATPRKVRVEGNARCTSGREIGRPPQTPPERELRCDDADDPDMPDSDATPMPTMAAKAGRIRSGRIERFGPGKSDR